MVRPFRRLRRIGLASSAICFGLALSAQAQVPLELTPDGIQRMLQSQPQFQQQYQMLPQLQQTPPFDLRPTLQLYQPVDPSRMPLAPPSRLEGLYSARAGRPLTQFGYEVLGVPTPVSALQVGAVQDSYMIGEGDEIVVVLRGQENTT